MNATTHAPRTSASTHAHAAAHVRKPYACPNARSKAKLNPDYVEFLVHPDLAEDKLKDDKGNYRMQVIKVRAASVEDAISKAFQRGYIPSNTLIPYYKAVLLTPSVAAGIRRSR